MNKYFLITFVFLNALFILAQENNKPFSIGEVKEIKSEILSENRIINIYLPQGYNSNDTIKYPVIYLLDGSADEDFIHIAGLIQFGNFEWVNLCPKSIVVGIANVDRKRDFSFPTTIEKDKIKFPTSGQSEKFIEFLKNELQPFISNKYKVTKKNTLIGQSLGGLLATQILFEKPDMFDDYIIVSPSIWWDNESILKHKINSKFYDGKRVFLTVGGKEDSMMITGAQKLNTLLQKNKIKTFYSIMPEKNHGDILHLAVYKAFQKLYKKNTN